MGEIILGIHSNVAGDGHGYTAGHAWLTLTEGGTTTFYGLWPDAHPRTVDNGDGSDIRIGLEASAKAVASRYYRLTPAQAERFRQQVAANAHWEYTYTCAAWASDVVAEVIGEDVDADDFGGFETPRELGQSILDLEAAHPTSVSRPRRLARNPATSMLTGDGSSSSAGR